MRSGNLKNGATGELANKRTLASPASFISCRPMRIFRLKWPSPTFSGEYMAMLQLEAIWHLPFFCRPEGVRGVNLGPPSFNRQDHSLRMEFGHLVGQATEASSPLNRN